MNFTGSAVPNIEMGRLYLVDMNPPRKSKPGKARPVVVIQSSDTIELGTPGIVIVPVTSLIRGENILRVRINPIPGLKLKKASEVLLDQIHTIDRELFIEELGELAPETFLKITSGVRFLLDF